MGPSSSKYHLTVYHKSAPAFKGNRMNVRFCLREVFCLAYNRSMKTREAVIAGPAHLLPDTGGLELTYNQSDDVRSALFYESALDTRDQYSYFLGGNTSLIEIATGAGTGRRLLVLKDSYAHCFAPLLVQDFDQVDLLDLRYFTGSLHEYMESRGYTDVLVLYNAAGFAEDTSLARLAA